MFTPVNETSAIGRVACLVTEALLDTGHEVAVVRTELAGDQGSPHPFPLRIINWTDTASVESAIRTSDVSVHQIGNHYGFHAGSLAWLERARGIVCLHDFYIGNLFHGWCKDTGATAQNIVGAWYGDETARLYGDFPIGPDPIAVEYAPMTEWVAAQADAVLTHSTWGIGRVLNGCPGPVAVSPLPYESPCVGVVDNANRRASVDDLTQFRIITVGHANSNKQIPEVIRAIASNSTLRKVTTYRLVGAIEDFYATHIEELAQSLGVRVTISGAVDRAALVNAFDEADAVVALRWPCLEAGSASAVESMLMAKPTIVTDAGSFRDIPDDCVIKIPIDAADADLAASLVQLAGDPAARLALGQRAQRHALSTHRADRYAADLVHLSAALLLESPQLRVARLATRQLAAWGFDPSCGLPLPSPPFSQS